jgi:hypothetical protein
LANRRLLRLMLNWLLCRVERLPQWSLPAVCGAVFLGGIVCVRLLVVLPVLFTDPARVAEGLVVVCVAAAGGTAGGLVYSFVGRPLLRTPRVGPYLAAGGDGLTSATFAPRQDRISCGNSPVGSTTGATC